MPGKYSSANLIRSENLRCQPGKIINLSAKLENEAVKEDWLNKLANPNVPKVIDLFSGAGGMSEGFVNAGFTVVGAFDKDAAALKTFAANIAARTVCGDIGEIENPREALAGLNFSQIDVIIGGPPCQGFSQVGKARIRSLEQEEQVRLLARNELYRQFFRFIEVFEPEFFVMENVPNLATFENGAYFMGIKKESERLGYRVSSRILDSAEYGVPQRRRRLIIVGSKTGGNKGDPFWWPKGRKDIVSLEEAIGDLPKVLPDSPEALEETRPYQNPSKPGIYQQLMRCNVVPGEKGLIFDHIVRPVRQDDIVIFSMMKPGDKYTDVPEEYRRYNSESFKDKYYKLKPEAPGVTITAHLDKDGYRYIHYDAEQHRTISVREAARIQSFGDHFRFCGSRSARFRQIGNAVPPILAEALAEKILIAMRRSRNELEWLPGDVIQLGLPGEEQNNKLVMAYE